LGPGLFRTNGCTDRRTNKHDEANSRFSQFLRTREKMLARFNFPVEFLPDFGVGLNKKLQALQTVMAFEAN